MNSFIIFFKLLIVCSEILLTLGQINFFIVVPMHVSTHLLIYLQLIYLPT